MGRPLLAWFGDGFGGGTLIGLDGFAVPCSLEAGKDWGPEKRRSPAPPGAWEQHRPRLGADQMPENKAAMGQK